MEASRTFFVHLSYAGAAYHGWQRQPNGVGVQQVLEEKLAVILRQPASITGCGRTDTGVHASTYYAHFSWSGSLPNDLIHRWNSLLPTDIAVHQLYQVPPEAHARFDAIRRGYSYYINTNKNPFRHKQEWLYPMIDSMDYNLIGEAAQMLLRVKDFSTFCKSHHDAKTPICQLSSCRWEKQGTRYVFHVESDRFLRGMVRMIVGMCLQVGSGKISLEEVKDTIDRRAILRRAWSVPADGLYLDLVVYPDQYLEHPLY